MNYPPILPPPPNRLRVDAVDAAVVCAPVVVLVTTKSPSFTPDNISV